MIKSEKTPNNLSIVGKARIDKSTYCIFLVSDDDSICEIGTLTGKETYRSLVTNTNLNFKKDEKVIATCPTFARNNRVYFVTSSTNAKYLNLIDNTIHNLL